MANNYTDFSFEIYDLTGEELFWLSERERCGFEMHTDVSSVCIYSDGEGDLAEVEELLLVFMQRFRPQGVVGFEFAQTCSKPRVGEFGGGAIVVYGSGHVEWTNTSDWLEAKLRDHERAQTEKGGE